MTILVYGATGTTGRLVTHALLLRGERVTVAGRDLERTRAFGREVDAPARAAHPTDAEALARMCEGADVVLSCAGPFSELGEPVLRAALTAGASFADISGEQHYARDIYQRYESRARREGLAVVTGLSFEPALADWAAGQAAAALGGGAVDEVSIAHAYSRTPLSPGMVSSIRAALRAPAWTWSRGRWEPAALVAERALVSFPAPLGERLAISAPLPAAITIPRHIETAAVKTLVAAGPASPGRKLALSLAKAAAPALSALAASAAASEVEALGPSRPTRRELERSRVAVVAEVKRGFSRSRVALAGADPYRLTAAVAAIAAPALRGRQGALAPAELIAPAEALGQLCERGDIEVDRGL